MEREMGDRAQSEEGQREIAEAVGRVERELIRAILGERRRSDGSDGDFTSSVRCPKIPKPTPNQSAVAVRLDTGLVDDER